MTISRFFQHPVRRETTVRLPIYKVNISMEMHVDNFLRRLYIVMLFVVCLFTTAVLLYRNGSYYVLPETERPYHQKYEQLKPSGIESHAFGIFGSVLIISGVALYSTRKRIRRFSDVGRIKNFLEVHIFLCLFGPTLILFHTTFKFGGPGWRELLEHVGGGVERYRGTISVRSNPERNHRQ